MGLGEVGELGFGEGVVHTTACDDQRLLGVGDRRRGRVELMDVGSGPGQVVDLLVEEPDREVVGLGRDVLGEADERRAAVGRVEHRLHRVR